MKENCNKGVQCNVCECSHNEEGKKCDLESIDVSKGSGNHHYCKSYKCKDECECGCKVDENDILS